MTRQEAFEATRLYLYQHVFFHHVAETFTSKLEVPHREKMYLDGQRPLYANTKGSDQNLEEALAEAYALDKVNDRLNSDTWGWSSQKRDAFLTTLRTFIRQSGPAYARGVKIWEQGQFVEVRNEFAERILAYSPPSISSRGDNIWSIFGHGFRGLANVLSNVKYVVRVGRPLAERVGLTLKSTTSGTHPGR